MIKFDSEQVVTDKTALIVKHPTGIVYEVQAGGIGCTHPKVEGFILDWGNLGQDFDDCSFGCAYISQDEGLRDKLAKALSEYLLKETERSTCQTLFDFDRVSELEEGWWPVVVIGKIADQSVNWKGYLHTQNCD